MSNFLRDLALAHQQHEGFYPGSASYRNNNPGNLRAGLPHDMNGFTVYPAYEAGLAALEYDVKAKICGHSSHIDYSKNPTFLTYVRVYAPADDGNDPSGYCQALCAKLSAYNVHPDTPLTVLAQLVNGENTSIAAPVAVDPPVTPQILQQKLQTAENALQWANPARARLLNRLIDRIKSILPIS